MTNVINLNTKAKPQHKELSPNQNSLVEEFDYMMTSTVDLFGFLALTIYNLPSNSPERFAEAKDDLLKLLRGHKRSMKLQRKHIAKDGFEFYDGIVPIGLWRDERRTLQQVNRCEDTTETNVVVLYRDSAPIDYFEKAIDALRVISIQHETISTATPLDKDQFHKTKPLRVCVSISRGLMSTRSPTTMKLSIELRYS